MDNLLVNRDFK